MTGKREGEMQTVVGQQKLLLTDRTRLELTGVKDVTSFDENGAILQTTLGTLAVDGEDLHVTQLDLAGGFMHIEGKLTGFFYSEEGSAKNRKKRLFR